MDFSIPATKKAKLVPLSPDLNGIEVQFNPASLVYTIENSTSQPGAPKRTQYAAQFSGKLTMDLQFDTSDTGKDVRQLTSQVAQFMQASGSAARDQSGASAQAQPLVSFQWGSYEFTGTMESFRETIDFFSSDGVPLRAVVAIGLARLDNVFDQDAGLPGGGINSSLVPTSGTDSATGAATRGGDASAARQLGTDNGLENLRFTGGAALQVNGGIQLNAAAGFAATASAGASVGVGGGASFGASAGVASSASLQMSAGVGGGPLFGGQASAGVPATGGAFAGLETGRATVSSTARLNPLRMLRASSSADVSTGANASFSLGGAANASSGFSTPVGASFSFSDQLVFDSE